MQHKNKNKNKNKKTTKNKNKKKQHKKGYKVNIINALYIVFLMNDEKQYDVSEYTDEELYQVLDLNNPTDRELEAQIVQHIKKYNEQDTPETGKLAFFFEEIYDHFFQNSEEEEEGQEGFTTANQFEHGDKASGVLKPQIDMDKVEQLDTINQNVLQTPLTQMDSSNPRTHYTTNITTGPSQINPLLKETMKRLMFVDSQFRNFNLYPNSTDFKFNLSEPLHHVISLKLHSVTIPYTWYNISNMYNANYIVLEVTNDDGDVIKKVVIMIEPGVYDEVKLLVALNTAIVTAAATYPAVNFGTTQFIYSSVSNKIQIKLDLTYTDPDTTITYHTEDFKLIFFKPNGESNQKSVEENYDYEFITWNVTLGWVLGYRNYPEYDLDPTAENNAKYVKQNQYSYDALTHIVTLTANTCFDINTCKTMYLIINDHTNHHLNDGLVTIEASNNNRDYPRSINISELSKNDDGTINVGVKSAIPNQHLTENQVYSANAVISDRQQNIQNAQVYSEPPFLKDMFAVIPIKLSGIKPGQLYTEFGGGMMMNSRVYFGPVHIKKMHVQLMNDKGDVIDLNNTDWNFSLEVEYLYNYNRT